MNFKCPTTQKNKSLHDILIYTLIQIQDVGSENVEVWFGTDSQNHGRKTHFVSVICVYRKRKGAKVFIWKDKTDRVQSNRQRMIHEAWRTFDVAKAVEKEIEDREMIPLLDIKFVVHVDVNPDPMFESNKAIKEVTGWLSGMNIPFKVKPNSHAATFAADHWAH